MTSTPTRPETSMPIDPDDLDAETEPKRRAQTIRPSDVVVDREALPLERNTVDALTLALYERSVTAEHAGIVTDDEGPTTVAAANPDYPSDERVWRVAYLTGLERKVPGWKDWDSATARDSRWGFRGNVIEFQQEWRVAVPTYDFPASRLMPVGEMSLPVPEQDRTQTRSEHGEPETETEPGVLCALRSVTVNLNWQTAVHTDAGDLPDPDEDPDDGDI